MLLDSLVGYFVVFNAAGFSPRDLQRAQKASTLDDPIVYFLANSPDFVNSAGRVIVAADQAIAWGQANSIMYIGVCKSNHFPLSSRVLTSLSPQSSFNALISVRPHCSCVSPLSDLVVSQMLRRRDSWFRSVVKSSRIITISPEYSLERSSPCSSSTLYVFLLLPRRSRADSTVAATSCRRFQRILPTLSSLLGQSSSLSLSTVC